MKKPSNIIITIVFLIWFVGSIVGMIYCSHNDMPYLVITLFGQYFLVFGLFATIGGIRDKHFQPMTLLLVLIGIGAMACGLILQFGTASMENIVENLVPYLLLSIFVIAGVGMLMGGILYYQKKQTTCTYAVNAKVIDLKKHRSDGTTTYSPVYEYYYGGEYVKYESNTYTNVHVPQIGDYKELRINPSNPREVMEGSAAKALLIFFVIMGSMFVLGGIGGMIATYIWG